MRRNDPALLLPEEYREEYRKTAAARKQQRCGSGSSGVYRGGGGVCRVGRSAKGIHMRERETVKIRGKWGEISLCEAHVYVSIA